MFVPYSNFATRQRRKLLGPLLGWGTIGWRSALALCFALAAHLIVTPSAAQPFKKMTADWQLGCKVRTNNRPDQCGLIQSARDHADRAKFAVAIFAHTIAKDVELKVVAPLGIENDEGIKVLVDGFHEATVPVKKCDPSGCFGRMILDPDLVDRLRNGKRLTIQVLTSANEGYGFQLSLSGLSQGLDEIKKHLDPSYTYLSELSTKSDGPPRQYEVIARAKNAGSIPHSCKSETWTVTNAADAAKITRIAVEVRDFVNRCGETAFVGIRPIQRNEMTATARKQLELEQQSLAARLIRSQPPLVVGVWDPNNEKFIGTPP